MRPHPRPPVAEPLEQRRLFATIIPPGFIDAAFGGQVNNGTAMDFAPDGRLFVLTQGGTVRVIQANGTLNAAAALTLTVDSAGERGLLGIAFDPDFDATTDGVDYVYLYHTVPAPVGGSPNNRISRFEVVGDTITAASATLVMNLDPLSVATNHNGGAIHFGHDGKLYATVGDNASSGNAQSVGTRLGKILRINKDGTIPDDNPASFMVRPTSSTTYQTVMPAGVNRAIWAVGLRNPYTSAVDPVSGQIFINDVGEGTWEEINVGGAGRNYGWPRTEGDFNQATNGNQNFTRPLYAYSHGTAFPNGNAISGGAFYKGSTAPLQFPQTLQGRYFFGEYVRDWIASVNPAAPAADVAPQFASGSNGIVDLKLGNDGALYYLQRETSAGGILPGVRRVRVNPATAPSITEQPDDQEVNQGDDATFTVVATGPGTLTYQWTRDGVDIPGATQPSYTLPDAQLADDGADFRVRVGNANAIALSNQATLDVVPADTVPPTVSAPAFEFETRHAVTLAASEALVGATTGAVFENLTTQQTLAPDDFTGVADPNTHAITYTFPGLPNGILPDGNWRLTLPSAAVGDLAGNALDGDNNGSAGGDFTFDFFVLAGDANRDREVSVADVGIVATNFESEGDMTFSLGDFNYDGKVTVADVGILGTLFGTVLEGPAPAALATSQAREASRGDSSSSPSAAPAARSRIRRMRRFA